MKKIVCFGDSITEMGTILELRGFIAQLADRYARRADVMARGFSGYTTRDGRETLQEAVLSEKPDTVVLFFGTNDSCLPGQIQHIEVDVYRKNMEYMAQHIAVTGAWLVLITPPPLNERKTKSRTMEHTETYAQACFELGLEMNLPVVDLFHIVQEEPEWQNTCLMDGIHMTARGMDVLFNNLCSALDKIQPFESFERIGIKDF